MCFLGHTMTATLQPDREPSLDHLCALPIRGEAFLLRRAGRWVLVDGGYDRARLADAINAYDASITHIDIVVCTHADEDHAGGLGAFLKEWHGGSLIQSPSGRTIGQIWLPGSWISTLPPLLAEPRKIIDDLIDALDRLISSHPELATADSDISGTDQVLNVLVRSREDDLRGDSAYDSDAGTELEYFEDIGQDGDIDITPPVEEPDWFKDIRMNCAKAVADHENADAAFRSGRGRLRYRLKTGKVSKGLYLFWLNLISTAANIRNIAEQAVVLGIRVRWFDFQQFAKTRSPNGGIPKLLMPLNSVEQAPPPVTDIDYFAALTAVNRESLVFLAPTVLSERPLASVNMGVIFTSDSPLGDGTGYRHSFFHKMKKLRFPLISTAPHHGSESNSVAYIHLQNWASIMVWVRTGGDKRQPGSTFKSLEFPGRICTNCPQSNKSDLRLAMVSTEIWAPLPSVVAGYVCDCK